MLLAIVTSLENTSNPQERAVWDQDPLVAEEAEAGTETATDAAGEAEDDVHWVSDEQEEMPDEEVAQQEVEVELAT